ncbi:MAG: flippase [candidate division Zixibacteria bacterium]|nr:flippase [candidate division Zixibacteria bacterium]
MNKGKRLSTASECGVKKSFVPGSFSQPVKKHGTTVRIIQNSGSILLYTSGVKVLKLVSFLLLARYLGVSQFGKFSLVLAFVELFRVMADFGVDTAVIRRLSVSEEDQSKLVGNTISLKLILATASYFLTILIALILRYPADLVLLIGLAAFALFASATANALTTPFQAQLRMKQLIPAKISGGAFFIIAVAIGIQLGLSLTGFLAIWVGAEFVTLLLTALIAKSWLPPKFSFNGKRLKPIFVEAIPLGISAILITAYFRLGILILGWMVGYQAVGEYAVVYRITESFLILGVAIAGSVYPIFSKIAKSGDFQRFKRALIKVYGGSLLLGALFAAFVTIFAKQILGLISSQYQGSLSPLILLSWACVFMFANMQSAASIQGLGLFKLVTLISSFNLILNVLLNLYLIPLLGATGVAWAILLTEGVNMIIQLSLISLLLRKKITGDYKISSFLESLPAERCVTQ